MPLKRISDVTESHFTIDNILHVPNLTRDFLFISQLTDLGYYVTCIIASFVM